MITDEKDEVEPEPESSRSQWGDNKRSLHLSGMPLEQTASQMEGND